MPRRLWLSAGLLAAGAALLATARLAGANPPTSGIFRVGIAGASVQIDPQVSYVSTGWWLEYATAAKLYNWSDRGNRLVPEVASRFAVSNYGRTYTFYLRKGFRFSDGSPVAAKNFAYAIDRVANHDLESSGAAFITDPSRTDIVGAGEVLSGQGTHVRGVVVRNPYKLVIHLTQPDGSFLLKLTMPFFQATSMTLPLTHEVVEPYPSAGPYAFTHNEANVLTSIRRNPYYRRGPGRMRPHHVGGVDISWSLDEQAGFEQVMHNQLDEGPIPISETTNVAHLFGVNKTRFWVKPVNCIGALVFNNRRPLFKNNVRLRKAVNWVVDRRAFASTAGPYTGSPWTHLIPPGFPGVISAKRLQPYAGAPNIRKARKLAVGHFRSGKIVVLYRYNSNAYQLQAQLVRRDLGRLGFKDENIEMKPFNCEIGGCRFPADLAVSWGWCSEFPDPYDFLAQFFNTYPGVNPAIDNQRYRRRLEAARRLVGAARLRALGRLDLEIMKNLAPLAPVRTYNTRYLFSDRVDPRGLMYSGVYQDWSIPALRLK